MIYSATDHAAMARALELAERGLFSTTPNPRVGCVIVRDGRTVGEGWHERAGTPHAEIVALQRAGAAAQGATAYVTLEPCSHFGRTPPCADALIDAGIERVVAAMEDPNPLVSGRGLARLRANGIRTESGLMREAATELNPGFISRMTRGRPWLRLKSAASLDGKVALRNGLSQWITGAEARVDGHRWRARACAILTGIGTVLKDDPALTVRGITCERQPLRVLVDTRLDIPESARLLHGGNCLVVCAEPRPASAGRLEALGVEVLCMPTRNGSVDLVALMHELARRGCNELHVEGGPRLNGALLQTGLADELLIYLAPRLIGDLAQGMFSVPELTDLGQAISLSILDVRTVGRDLRVIARPTGG
ncbi:MAG: bifunctional diaminohydroxyphosphoribosylaminopyrimidine deaminase/5-amino-6-(5-phosphoribosylamino)uracil reductase RibD [Rhodocyclaceae bacterium]|jgi:diaminohydroxyphosphoribosylaminopyrimidine deaminase/5-amino-6-(5-phosphoribosylamino)uracil reductase|nr:bifunctional diaminohydroxyphosphoribosylaminopyrimidine deaminase/5-amino-6-(5-phosphoribosylamino)uracil reductase RibD [Rhodocyclaceae bacterium]MCL4756941.1 bifunctional diaminohydroxyphosphoribosylaminopyrimidine deaminase/5-amino-6-(5-phosphoribosylamino)uracil reductase RibD [Rhodocyclaceae bacterium]